MLARALRLPAIVLSLLLAAGGATSASTHKPSPFQNLQDVVNAATADASTAATGSAEASGADGERPEPSDSGGVLVRGKAP